MGIYSTRLAGGYVDDSYPQAVNPPAGSVYVVRDIIWWYNTPADILIGELNGTPCFEEQAPGGQAGNWHWTGRLVLEPGDSLVFTTDNSDATAVWISGYALSA